MLKVTFLFTLSILTFSAISSLEAARQGAASGHDWHQNPNSEPGYFRGGNESDAQVWIDHEGQYHYRADQNQQGYYNQSYYSNQGNYNPQSGGPVYPPNTDYLYNHPKGSR